MSLPPNAPTETGVTEGEGEAKGLPVPPTELDELGVHVDDGERLGETVGERLGETVGERLGETVGEGDAEKGARAYSLPLSENTTVLPASMGAPVMGCAAGVV